MIDFSTLKGQTLVDIRKLDDSELPGNYDEAIVFVTDDGDRYIQKHENQCCEQVSIEDICGDFSDLIGNPILLAEEVITDNGYDSSLRNSSTHSFYKLSTIKGSVTIRWYGTSSGLYSETVTLTKLPDSVITADKMVKP